LLFSNPKKKANSIINNIEKGTASESNIIDLGIILNKEPSLVSEIVSPVISILQNFDKTSLKPAILALNVVADTDTGLISDHVDVIASCLQKDLHTGEILNLLEIILKIYRIYPEKMSITVPGLFVCLRNIDATVRENAYFILESIAMLHPEFFKGSTKELNLALGGLNLDERIYACKIIKNIANKYPKIVEDSYESLSYLENNHPSRDLRIEAAAAIDKLKIKKEIEPPKVREDVLETEKKDKKETPNVPGVEYVIQRKENIDISSHVKNIIAGTDIKSPVLESVFNIAMDISREGREGKPVGTSFIVGNSKDVLAKSKQLIHNPVVGIPINERMITDPEFSNTIKELSQLDGAFVVSGNGLVEAACRFLTADASSVNISKGLGTKHFSVAAMTMATKAIGIVVSESGGRITIFKDGKILSSFS
jgi:DNA integrity scanning protein DisA with diadenylate cyclase activity